MDKLETATLSLASSYDCTIYALGVVPQAHAGLSRNEAHQINPMAVFSYNKKRRVRPSLVIAGNILTPNFCFNNF